MSNAKKNVSMRIDDKYVQALDILTKHVPEHLPVENRSLLMSYLLKSFIYQIVNDKETFMGDNFKVKQELDKIHINRKTLVMMDNVEAIKFCEETKIVEEQKELRILLEKELADLKAEFDKYITSKAKLEAEIKSLESYREELGGSKTGIKKKVKQSQEVAENVKIDAIEYVQVVSALDSQVLLLLITDTEIKDYCDRHGIAYENKGYIEGTETEVQAIIGIAKEHNVKLTMREKRMQKYMLDNAFFVEEDTYTNLLGVVDEAEQMKEEFRKRKEMLERKKNENQQRERELKERKNRKKQSNRTRNVIDKYMQETPQETPQFEEIERITVYLSVIDTNDSDNNFEDSEDIRVNIEDIDKIGIREVNAIQESLTRMTGLDRFTIETEFDDRTVIEALKSTLEDNDDVVEFEISY